MTEKKSPEVSELDSSERRSWLERVVAAINWSVVTAFLVSLGILVSLILWQFGDISARLEKIVDRSIETNQKIVDVSTETNEKITETSDKIKTELGTKIETQTKAITENTQRLAVIEQRVGTLESQIDEDINRLEQKIDDLSDIDKVNY